MTTEQVEVPEGWPGSEAAYMAYRSIVRYGKSPDRDFTYSPRGQGRRLRSDTEIDFLFEDPPDLALHIREGLSTHPVGEEPGAADVITKAQLAGQGIKMIFLDHDKIIQDPDWVISEALQYREHSWG